MPWRVPTELQTIMDPATIKNTEASMIKHIKRGAKKIYASLALLSIEIILIIIFFGTSLLAFLYIAKMVFADKKEEFDISVFHFLSGHVSNLMTSFMEFFTFFGAHIFLI